MTDIEDRIAPEIPGESGLNTWRGVAPLPDGGRPAGAGEAAALILGILALCIHWTVFFSWGLFLFVVPLILSVLAIVFGYATVHRLFRKDYLREAGEGTVGLVGMSLGVLALMFTIAWLVIAQTYLWGWDL